MNIKNVFTLCMLFSVVSMKFFAAETPSNGTELTYLRKIHPLAVCTIRSCEVGSCLFGAGSTAVCAYGAAAATSSAPCIVLSVGAGVSGCATALLTPCVLGLCLDKFCPGSNPTNSSDVQASTVTAVAIVPQQVMMSASATAPTRTQTLQ